MKKSKKLSKSFRKSLKNIDKFENNNFGKKNKQIKTQIKREKWLECSIFPPGMCRVTRLWLARFWFSKTSQIQNELNS